MTTVGRLKVSNIFMIVIFTAILFSCSKDDDTNFNITQYSENDANKIIIKTVVTNTTTAFNNLFSENITDSIVRASIIKEYTHNANFLDDESGYIFIETFSGYNISHPAKPDIEGSMTLNETDADGDFIIQKMIDIVKYTGEGFLKYNLLNPINNIVEPKTTFIKSIPTSSWYAGSGFYHTSGDSFVTAKEVNEKMAVNSVRSMSSGIGALYNSHVTDSLQGVELMQNMLSKVRLFDDQSGYFFVISFSGYNMVQPPDPDFQGTYELDIQDSRGTYLVQGLIETAQNGGGFYEYYWNNYQTGHEELKKAYVKQIPGQNYLIGVGVYLKD